MAAVAAWQDYSGEKLDGDDLTAFEEAYGGEWESEEAYAEDYWESTGQIPDSPLSVYIDWERVARDLFIESVYSVENPTGGIFVFYRL